MTKLLSILAVFLVTTGIFGGEPKGDSIQTQTGTFEFRTNDVVAFLGGADVVAAQQSGHLETLLTVGFQKLGLHFRNLGWEGSTVFDHQPRDVGFPMQKTQLEKAGASIVFLQYGRAEALAGGNTVVNFRTEYEKLIEQCLLATFRIILVTPPPFENGGAPLPDLSARNKDLAELGTMIRELAQKHHLASIDVFSELGGDLPGKTKLTENGLQLTARGQAIVARAFMHQLRLGKLADSAGEADLLGRWSNAGFERLRQEVVAKNQLWFNYWRPQNWAFLGGDRTSQPSSRDHQNPAIRWFPDEMDKFVPLIQEAEKQINKSVEATSR